MQQHAADFKTFLDMWVLLRPCCFTCANQHVLDVIEPRHAVGRAVFLTT